MALIDPNSAFNNGVPNPEDLNIFAELKIYRRRYNDPNKPFNDKTALDKEIITVVNFLGFDKASRAFTTNYTENGENFGITNITLKLDSSYVPQINIDFVDVRGQSFFKKGGASKYAGLLDFPPPIFELTLKGYYGKKVNYRLHLVKQNSRFDSSSGNFIISANLIGLTYAPLADLFLSYIKAAPYFYGKNFTDGNIDTTVELISACNTITDRINKVISRDKDESNDFLTKKTLVKDKFLGAGTRLEFYLNSNFETYPTQKFENVPTDVVIKLKSGQVYGTASSHSFGNGLSYDELKAVYEQKNIQINKFKNDIADFPGLNGSMLNLDSFIKQFPTLDDFVKYFRDETVFDKNLLIIKNIPDFVTEINRYISDLDVKINNKNQEMISKTTDVAIQTFGGDLTVKRIFAIILGDVDLFCKKIKEISQNVLNDPARSSANTGDSLNEPMAFPFPTCSKEITQGSQTKRVKSLPPADTVEAKFIDDLITAIIKSGLAENELNSTSSFDNTKDSSSDWFGLNANDSEQFISESPYKNKNLSNIYRTIIGRANDFLFFSSSNEKILSDSQMKTFAEAEAYNVVNSLNVANKKVIDELSEDLENGRTQYKKSLEINDNNTTNFSARFSIYKSDSTFFKKGVPDLLEEDKLESSTKPLDKKVAKVVDALSLNWLSSALNYIFGDTRKSGVCQYNIPFYTYEGTSNTLFNDGDIRLVPHAYADDFDNLITNYPGTLSAKQIGDAIHGNVSGVYKLSILDVAVMYKKLTFYGTDIATDMATLKPYYDEVKNWFDNKIKGKYVGGNYDDAYIKLWEDEIYSNYVYLYVPDPYVFLQDSQKTRVQTNQNPQFTLFVDTVLNTLQNEALKDLKVETTKQELNIGKTLNDIDLKTEVYYNIKSFHDRWILGGYDIFPDVDNGGLLNNFKFIDRGYHDIGDLMILDLLPIAELELDGSTSVYTLILQLLTKNNMEFFALPTYQPYMQGGWDDPNTIKDIFGTFQNLDPVPMAPQFICMYVGGTSAVLSIEEEDSFKRDDGAYLDSPTPTPDLVNVNAFKVTYGYGTNSIFTNVNVDQEEFKQTLESIKILDKIAKSQDEQVVKSQNLFSVYEQRSYSAEVEMMGCAMIQPTMYFTLDLPLWRGVYLILEVNHTITPNVMMTRFKGVRVPDKTKPFLTNYATYAGLTLSEGTNTYGGTVSSSIGSGAYIKNTPWSAAFISYCNKKADCKFPRSMGHTDYAQKIRNNPSKYDYLVLNPANVGEVYIGDILVENRDGNSMSFNTPTWSGPSHGDIVVLNPGDHKNGIVEIVGGNKSNSVKKESFKIVNGKLPSKYFVLLRPKYDGLRSRLSDVANEEYLKWRNGGWNELSVNAKPSLKDYYAAAGVNLPIDSPSQGFTPIADGLKGEALLANDAFKRKLNEVSSYLGCSSDSLVRIMRVESELNPQSQNIQGGRLIAGGLLQFTNSGMSGWGVSISDIVKMSGVQQLDYVRKYFEPKRGKLDSYEKVFTYTFFPAAFGKPDSYILQSKTQSASLISKQNAGIAKYVGKTPGTPLTYADFKKFYNSKGLV